MQGRNRTQKVLQGSQKEVFKVASRNIMLVLKTKKLCREKLCVRES